MMLKGAIQGLSENELPPEPIEQFHTWYEAAKKAHLHEPHAMTLATATPDGTPASRIVLMKDYSADGFVFYTNYQSRKGRELVSNPRVSLLFHWNVLERQVRVEGVAEKVSAETSNAYFQSRGRGSRIGAWASRQSEVIESREVLEARVEAQEERFSGGEVPLPPFWGGFQVRPHRFEFWQGRANRLHDRLVYVREHAGLSWRIERLSP